jgi:hypothetical protein
MFEVQTELRQAYLTKLSTVAINGISIPFYDERVGASPAQIGTATAYGLIANQTAQDILVKCGFYQDCSITIDIVTKYPKQKGGKLLSEQISNQVLQLIRTGSTLDYPIMDNFQIVTCRKTLDRGLTEDNVSDTVYRKLLIFTHKIKQISTTT